MTNLEWNLPGYEQETPVVTMFGPIDGSEDARLYVPHIRGLASRGDVEGVARFLRDKDWRVRITAVIGLGVVGDMKAAAYLVRCLQDEDARVCLEANKMLTGIFEQLEQLPSAG